MTTRDDFIRKPFPRSYRVVPGLLYAGAYPGDIDENIMETKIFSLLDCGICRVVNLMEASEIDHNGRYFLDYSEKLRELALKRVVEASVARFSIRDVSIPSQSLMKKILDHIDRNITEGYPTYVHCWGGKGRTGTVVGCYLARHGIAIGKDALETIKHLRLHDASSHEPSPETREQCDMVVSWKVGE
ncbi:MAG TPA: tyrosine-protein phosphatase [Methanoregulaceae archaeon]|nr:tyrosine-protein phosphatase [Methanoregulaceae archaeon]